MASPTPPRSASSSPSSRIHTCRKIRPRWFAVLFALICRTDNITRNTWSMAETHTLREPGYQTVFLTYRRDLTQMCRRELSRATLWFAIVTEVTTVAWSCGTKLVGTGLITVTTIQVEALSGMQSKWVKQICLAEDRSLIDWAKGRP